MKTERKRLLARGRIRAIISEEGVEIIEIGGKRFEGFDGYVPVPLRDLRYVRVGDIPEDVFIEPVEAVEGNTVYLAGLGTRLPFELRYWQGGVIVELSLWPGDWDEYVSPKAYLEGLGYVLGELQEWGFVDDLDDDYTGDMYHISFNLPLPRDITLLKSLRMVKRFIREVEKAATQIALNLALLEIREKARGDYDIDGLLERLDEILGRFGV